MLLSNVKYFGILAISMLSGSQFVFYFFGPDMHLHDEIQKARERRKLEDAKKAQEAAAVAAATAAAVQTAAPTTTTKTQA
jgi:hypothetical protein